MSFFYVFESFIWPLLLVILFYLLSRKRRDAIAALLESLAIRLLLLLLAASTTLFLGRIAEKSFTVSWEVTFWIAALVIVTGLAALLAGIWLGVRLGPGGSLRPLLALLIYPFDIFYAPIPIIGCLLGVWLSRKDRLSRFSYQVRAGDIRPLQFVPLLLVYALVYWGSPAAGRPAYLYLVIAVAVLFLAGTIFVLAEKVLLKVVKKEKPIETTEIESKPELEKEPQPLADKERLGKGRVVLSAVILSLGFLCFLGAGFLLGEFKYILSPDTWGDPGIAGMLFVPGALMFFAIGSVLLIAAGLILKKRWGWKIFLPLILLASVAIIAPIPDQTEIEQRIRAEKKQERIAERIAGKTRAEFMIDAITLKKGSPGVLWAMAADDYRVYENIVYLVNDKNLFAVDIKSGRKLWATELPNRPSLDTGDPYYATSEVIVLKAAGEEGSRLMAIDAQTGKVKSPVSIADDLVNDRIVAYDIESEQEKWTFKPPQVPPRDKDQDVGVRVRYLDGEVALIEFYSTAWASSAGNDIYVLDVQSGKMKLHYKNSLGREARIDNQEAVYKVDGLLIFQSVKTESEGREKRAVQILDLETGKEKWSFQREYITDVRVNIKDRAVELWDGRDAGIGDYRIDNYYALDLLTGKVKSKTSSKEKPAPSTIKAEIEKKIKIDDEMSPAYFIYEGKKYKSPSKISSDEEYIEEYMFVEPLYGGEYLMVEVMMEVKNHIYCVKP